MLCGSLAANSLKISTRACSRASHELMLDTCFDGFRLMTCSGGSGLATDCLEDFGFDMDSSEVGQLMAG